MKINWDDPYAQISRYFQVREALLLPSWGIYHYPSLAERANIEMMAQSMDQVREMLGVIIVHCWIRPTSVDGSHPANSPGAEAMTGKNYNALVSKARQSMHISGRAVDFHAKHFPGKAGCAEAREMLLPHLDRLGLRMEDIDGGWVHLDNKPAGNGNRFFKP